jgi:K+-transporting ATPase ATPase B chain
MAKRQRSTPLFQAALVNDAIKHSFLKLNPVKMFRNPVMFTVEIGTMVMAVVTLGTLFSPDSSQGSFGYNFTITLTLFLTVLFANFAEALAEARGKAQADSLRKTREETPAKKLQNGKVVIVSSSLLVKGDEFVCEGGDIVPADGEITEGIATIDESAITGESAPVIRESGGDKSSVTGGTKVLSDKIRVMVTTKPGESFLTR